MESIVRLPIELDIVGLVASAIILFGTVAVAWYSLKQNDKRRVRDRVWWWCRRRDGH